MTNITEALSGLSLTKTEVTSPIAQTSVEDLSPKTIKNDSCKVSTENHTKTTDTVEPQTIDIPKNEVEVQLEKETSTGSSQTEASASFSIEKACNASTQTEGIKAVATSADLVKAEGGNNSEESCRWSSSCERSKNDEIDSTSDNEWKSPGRGIRDSNDEALVKNIINDSSASHSGNYANGMRTSSCAHTRIEVQDPIIIQELSTQTVNTCEVSSETRDNISNSIKTQNDGNPKNEVEFQTEKGIPTVSLRKEIANIYPIAKAYDASAQTKMVKDVSTNFNNKKNIVSIKGLSEKSSADTDDNLKFMRLVAAQAIAEESRRCYLFCGQQKQQDSIEECKLQIKIVNNNNIINSHHIICLRHSFCVQLYSYSSTEPFL